MILTFILSSSTCDNVAISDFLKFLSKCKIREGYIIADTLLHVNRYHMEIITKYSWVFIEFSEDIFFHIFCVLHCTYNLSRALQFPEV